ncbi:hypothetical protein [Tsukamurella pseudospumae]|nr:hypothetical protein [Tsukamurella pseudospumae]
MTLSDDELFEDDPELDAYIEELTRDWPPPDSPAQLAVLRRVFGPHLANQEPAAGHSAKNSPAAGRHTSSKGHAA